MNRYHTRGHSSDDPRAREIPVRRNRQHALDSHELLLSEILSQGDISTDAGGDFKYGFGGGGMPPIASYSEPPSSHSATPAAATKSSYPPTKFSKPPPHLPGPMQMYVSPKIGIKDIYISFDSVFASETDRLNQGEIGFSVPQLNNNNPISNIIEMEITDFYFPDIPKPAYEPDYFFYARATVGINQMLTTQSIQGYNNLRWHFEFDVQNAGIARKFTPTFSKIIFQKPFQELQNITFTFRAPDKRIPIPKSVYNVRTIVSAPGTFDVYNDAGTATEDHNLPAGNSTVYFTNFNNGFDALGNPIPPQNINAKSAVENPDGNLILNVAPAQVQLNALLNPATTTFAFAGDQAQMIVGSRRFSFVIRFRTIVDGTTNHIVPV